MSKKNAAMRSSYVSVPSSTRVGSVMRRESGRAVHLTSEGRPIIDRVFPGHVEAIVGEFSVLSVSVSPNGGN